MSPNVDPAVHAAADHVCFVADRLGDFTIEDLARAAGITETLLWAVMTAFARRFEQNETEPHFWRLNTEGREAVRQWLARALAGDGAPECAEAESVAVAGNCAEIGCVSVAAATPESVPTPTPIAPSEEAAAQATPLRSLPPIMVAEIPGDTGGITSGADDIEVALSRLRMLLKEAQAELDMLEKLGLPRRPARGRPQSATEALLDLAADSNVARLHETQAEMAKVLSAPPEAIAI